MIPPFQARSKSSSSASRRHGEGLDVAELSQKRVLVVVAAARHDPSLFVELTNLAELQGYPTTRRRERAQGPVVCAFDGELGDYELSRINVLGVGDFSIRESLCPGFRPFSEPVPRV